MARVQPPSFVSELKSYSEYKADLQRWSRLVTTSLDKKLQAEMVIYHLDGHPSGIKDKIVTQIPEDQLQSEDGIKYLIAFLDTIYSIDDIADVWDKYKTFSNHHRRSEQEISDFLQKVVKCQKVGLSDPGCS